MKGPLVACSLSDDHMVTLAVHRKEMEFTLRKGYVIKSGNGARHAKKDDAASRSATAASNAKERSGRAAAAERNRWNDGN